MDNNKKKEIIGIIGAMDSEVALLKESAHATLLKTIASMDFYGGVLHGKDVVIVKCGMGKVNAGICAHTLINEFHCDKVINTGVAGSLDAKMDIGDIVISVDAVQHDFNVEPIGFKRGEIPYTGLYAFPADESMRAVALDAVKSMESGIHVFEGRVCSGDQFITTMEEKDTITNRFGGLCCEMEGGAIAQSCYLNNTPFVIIRAISDKPNGNAGMDFALFQEKAARIVANVVFKMLENL